MNSCLIRCEYSSDIGFGHLMRCLVLAAEFNRHGYRVYVLSSAGRPDISNSDLLDIVDRWYMTDEQLGSTADVRNLISVARTLDHPLVILDFYGISDAYQLKILEVGLKWLQLDGWADQPLWSDWVLSISPSATEDRYFPLRQRPETAFLLGPKYAILRQEFRKRSFRARTFGDVKQVLLTFGGGNDMGVTLFCLRAIKKLQWDGVIYVVVGNSNPNASAIAAWVKKHGAGSVMLSVDEPDMARVMCESDMAVISGGMTTFEAAATGLPSLSIRIADNQRANVKAWNHMGVSQDLGEVSELTEETFSYNFMSMVRSVEMRRNMSRTGMLAVDGLGAKRVVDKITCGGRVSSV